MKKTLGLIACAILVLGLAACGSTSKLELQKETFTVEYGETISTSAKYYLKKDSEKEVIKNTKITVKKLENEKDKEYPAVGTYDANAKYNEESKSFKIKVEDTTAPTFVDLKESVEVDTAYTGDFKEFFTVQDLSEVTITINTEKVNLAIAGEYELSVTATDASKNKTKETVKVIVKEPVEETPVTNNETVNNNSTSGNTSNNISSGSSDKTTPNTNAPANVCVPGTPNPAEIGNSGLLLTPAEYDALWDLWDWSYANESNMDSFRAKYGGHTSFTGWTIMWDTCGNPMETNIWTIKWTD